MLHELLNKYIWLIQTLISSGEKGLLLDEVQSMYYGRFSEKYTRRTFCNHREAIKNLFGITIACRRSDSRYYIPFLEEAMDNSASTNWLIDTFTVNNCLNLGKERLSGRVSVEEIPSGHKFLTKAMDAMQKNRTVNIVYRKYDGQGPEELTVDPYAVKEVEKRWYLVAFCHQRKGLRVYGLDRILSFEETEGSFVMPGGFDVDSLFSESFGIYLPEGKKAQLIILRTSPREAGYLRDLPLHPSQVEIPRQDSSDDEVYFAIRVVPNDNLIMEICKRGDRLEVIEPLQIRQMVSDALHRAASLYD